MPGRAGNKNVTVQNLKVVKVDVENNLLLIKGSVPGLRTALWLLKKALRAISKERRRIHASNQSKKYAGR